MSKAVEKKIKDLEWDIEYHKKQLKESEELLEALTKYKTKEEDSGEPESV